MRDRILQLRDLWEAATPTNRAALAGIGLALVVAAVLVAVWARSPEYAVLITDVEPSNGQEIVTFLKEEKIEYQLSEDGRTIRVPSSKKAELQMGLASRNLIRSGSIGNQGLDNISLGTPDILVKENIRRAAEGELENAIAQLEPVETAKVRIAPGIDSPFVTGKTPPKASVLLHLRTGEALSKDTIRAIANMVAHSYDGLTPASISMMDTQGNRLWDGEHQANGTSSSDERLAQQTAFTERLRGDISNALQKIVPDSRYDVIVTAVLNLDRERQNKRETIPGAPTTKVSTSENYSVPGSSGSSRPAGIASGLGGSGGQPQPDRFVQQDGKGDGGAQYTGEQSTTSLQPGTIVTETERSPGEVKSLSVAVLLDEKVPSSSRTAIQETVRTVIGAYPAPTGVAWPVTVQAVPFDTSAMAEQQRLGAQAAASEQMNRILSYAVPLGLMLLMLFILARGLKRPLAQDILAIGPGGRPMLAAAGAGAAYAGGNLDLTIGEALPEPGTSVGQALEVVPKPVYNPLDPDSKSFEVIEEAFDANLEAILHLSQTKPDIVAGMLRSWLSEDKR